MPVARSGASRQHERSHPDVALASLPFGEIDQGPVGRVDERVIECAGEKMLRVWVGESRSTGACPSGVSALGFAGLPSVVGRRCGDGDGRRQ